MTCSARMEEIIKMKIRDRLGDLDVDGRIILKLILKKELIKV
jgi:hypothetical protein